MKQKIVVTIEKGLVVNLLATEDIDVAVIDFDIDGIDSNKLTKISTWREANCYLTESIVDNKEVNKLYKLISDDLEQKEIL